MRAARRARATSSSSPRPARPSTSTPPSRSAGSTSGAWSAPCGGRRRTADRAGGQASAGRPSKLVRMSQEPDQEPQPRRARTTTKEQPIEHRLLMTATLCLLAGGAVMVYSASSARTVLEGQGDGTGYLVKYLMFGGVGL